MKIAEINTPLLNANEPEAVVVAIHKKDGDFIKKGDVVLTIETTKATSDIESPEDGYIQNLSIEGDIVKVGSILAYIWNGKDEIVERNVEKEKKNNNSEEYETNIDLRITNPAKKLAESMGINIDLLPREKLITEAVIRRYASTSGKPEVDLSALTKEPILIYGAGGHAKTIIDLIADKGEYTIIGIVDDDLQKTGKQIMGIPILGAGTCLDYLHQSGIRKAVNCVGGILDIRIRMRITKLLKNSRFLLPILIHSSSFVEPSARICDGSQILAKAYIGSEASIGEGCLVNTSAVISHDCKVGNHTHIAPGSLLAGNVTVGERTLVGMGVTTAIGINIGSDVRVGNGAILLADVPDSTIIQAGRCWGGH